MNDPLKPKPGLNGATPVFLLEAKDPTSLRDVGHPVLAARWKPQVPSASSGQAFRLRTARSAQDDIAV